MCIRDRNGEIREIHWGDGRFFFAIRDNLLIGSLSHEMCIRDRFGGASDYPGQESEGVFEFGQALFDGVRGWVLLSSAY